MPPFSNRFTLRNVDRIVKKDLNNPLIGPVVQVKGKPLNAASAGLLRFLPAVWGAPGAQVSPPLISPPTVVPTAPSTHAISLIDLLGGWSTIVSVGGTAFFSLIAAAVYIGKLKGELENVRAAINKEVDAKLAGANKEVDAKLAGAKETVTKEVDAKLAGAKETVTKEVDAKLAGATKEVDAKVAGVIDSARNAAIAGTYIVLKDYDVSEDLRCVDVKCIA